MLYLTTFSDNFNMKVTLLVILYSLSVLGHPQPRAAERCTTDNCKIENDCRCSSIINPINDPENPAPQLVAITVSEAIVQTLYNDTILPLFFSRTNVDGGLLGLTFYVPHEYTDYSLVQDLYLRGYEIGDHSITKSSNQSYWQNATAQDLEEEFDGQKIIISTFANIPSDDIVGVRTPQLQLEGDVSIDAYVTAGLTYDNSWSTMSTAHLLPYTLTYASSQACMVAIDCPTESHPDFWIAPITNIQGVDKTECSSLATCLIEGTAQEIADWLYGQIDIVRQANRAPLTLRLDSYWFQFTANSFEGFSLFLDRITAEPDVFLVSVQDIIEWIKDPVPASSYTSPDHSGRESECLALNCRLKNDAGDERYMKSCIPCPQAYPWKGNPYGDVQPGN